MKALDDLKVKGPIRKVTVNDKTFAKSKKREIENISLINYFYGNNGTGKSTVSDTIYAADPKHVTWEPGVDADSYTMMIFNQAFIDQNIQQYRNLPGVYTISEEASTAQAEIDKVEADISAAKKAEGEKETAKNNADKSIKKLESDIKDDLYKAADKYKQKYPLALNMQKATIFNGVVAFDNPQQQNEDEMVRLYKAAFADDSRDYDSYVAYEDFDVLDGIENLSLLAEEIKSSGTTEYAKLIKKLSNMVWLDEGHKKYQNHKDNSEKLCPFCGEPLPDDIDARIQSALDADYQRDMASLRELLSEYKKKAERMLHDLDNTNKPDEIYPGIDPKEYDDKVTVIRGLVAVNEQLLQEKINNPDKKTSIDPVKPLLEELKEIVEKYNKLIEANNAVRKKIPSNQKKFKDMFFEQLAYDYSVPMSRYATDKAAAEVDFNAKKAEFEDAVIKREEAEAKRKDIKVDLNTQPTIEEINAILKDVGFLGFELVPHPSIQYAYLIQRTDGSPADEPSEGEKNFIAFLYFYEKVKGYGIAESSTIIKGDGETENVVTVPDNKQKIVVIDDPVSSMDSGTMYVVGNLVRDMVANCEKAAKEGVDTIAQIFIFSHNAFFFRDIAYNRIKDFDYVNFYTVDKQDEISSLNICVKQTKHPNPEKAWANENPVKDNYNALWDEYLSAKSVTSLTNIIRRILEYYFLQMCGYEGESIYARVIDENRKLFTESELKVADSLLKYLDNEFHWLNDGLYYSDSAITADVCQRVFQKIFLYSGQDQHYRKMANEDISDDIKVEFEKRFEDVTPDEEALETSETAEPEKDDTEIIENE